MTWGSFGKGGAEYYCDRLLSGWRGVVVIDSRLSGWGVKPSLRRSCAAKRTIWRAAQQQACTRVSIWAQWE